MQRLLLGILFFLSPGWNVGAQNPPPLFKAVKPPIAFGDQEISTITGGIAVKRSRLVQVVLPLIDNKAAGKILEKAPKAFGEGPLDSLPSLKRIQLNLFDDVSLVADLRRVSFSNDGKTVIWVGTIEGVKDSQVSLATTDGTVSGNVSITLGKLYQIRPSAVAKGDSYILERDQSTFPQESQPVSPRPIQPRAADVAPNSDDGSTIDVLVAYTSSAKAVAGGQTGIQNLIHIGETETNQGYANSGVIQRVRVVYVVEVTYDETAGFDATLNRLATPNDGYLDEIQPLRDKYGADLVSLWINNSQSCGLAYVMNQPDPSFESSAFSVVNVSCATGYYSFGHEMGHNQGCQHDRANAVSPGAFPYSYGYQQTGANPVFRTIMGYPCLSTTCERINYWSNPDILYQGLETGVADASPNASDNATTLNNTRSIAAKFRKSVSQVVVSPSAAVRSK